MSRDNRDYDWDVYNEPDMSKGDYYCSLCDSRMNNKDMWMSHIVGKRHITNVKKKPGEQPSKVKAVLIDDRPMILDELDEIDEPVVGLEFVCEIRRSDPKIAPLYMCYLCHTNCTKEPMIEHLVTMKHRLNYLKKVDPKEADLIEHFRLPKSQLEPMVRNLAIEKQDQFGRGKMEVKIEKSHGQVCYKGKLLNKQYYNALEQPKRSSSPAFNYKPSNLESMPSTSKKSDAISNKYTPAAAAFLKSENLSSISAPKESFVFDPKIHSKYLTPKQVAAVLNAEHENIVKEKEKATSGVKATPDEVASSLRSFQLYWAAFIQEKYRTATEEQRKVLQYNFSKKGISDREQKIANRLGLIKRYPTDE